MENDVEQSETEVEETSRYRASVVIALAEQIARGAARTWNPEEAGRYLFAAQTALPRAAMEMNNAAVELAKYRSERDR
jgi:hypothetical protein